MDGRSDEELVIAAQGGATDATGVLFERHWADAWRLAAVVTGSRDRADDVAQQAFVRAVAQISTVREPARFAAWLHRIVVNEARDDLRRRRREVVTDEPPEEAAEDGHHMPGPALAALAELPPDRRAAVALRHCMGCSLEETADILGLPVGTVQSRAARGLAQLRAQLGVSDGT